jgi:hypothetical protein
MVVELSLQGVISDAKRYPVNFHFDYSHIGWVNH